MTPTLNIVCALGCEAKALIQILQLKKNMTVSQFQCYSNQAKNIRLIISGVGKINAAVATTFLAAQQNQLPQSFLNIGIAGGYDYDVGELLLVHKLTDQSSNKRYYPKINLLKKSNSVSLMTYERPVAQLPKTGLVDMEAAGFYQAALTFAGQEFIQVVKVVSDNAKQDQNIINEELVHRLMFQNIETMLAVIKQMQALQTANREKRPLDLMPAQIFHFSEQQKIQLKRLLQRAEVFNIDLQPIADNLDNSKAFIQKLSKLLGEQY